MKMMKIKNTEQEIFVILCVSHSIRHKLLLERVIVQFLPKFILTEAICFSRWWLTVTFYFFAHQYFNTPRKRVHARKNLAKTNKSTNLTTQTLYKMK